MNTNIPSDAREAYAEAVALAKGAFLAVRDDARRAHRSGHDGVAIARRCTELLLDSGLGRDAFVLMFVVAMVETILDDPQSSQRWWER